MSKNKRHTGHPPGTERWSRRALGTYWVSNRAGTNRWTKRHTMHVERQMAKREMRRCEDEGGES